LLFALFVVYSFKQVAQQQRHLDFLSLLWGVFEGSICIFFFIFSVGFCTVNAADGRIKQLSKLINIQKNVDTIPVVSSTSVYE